MKAEKDEVIEPVDLVALREYAESEFYDGDTDQGLKGYTQLLDAADEIERLRAALQTAQAQVRDYENAITWDTTCLNCSNLLDQSYADYQTIADLRAQLAAAGSQALRQVSAELRAIQTMPGNVALVDADWLDRRADSLAGLAGEPERCVFEFYQFTTHCMTHDAGWPCIDGWTPLAGETGVQS